MHTAKMKILVSGGAGFLGSNLCARLLKEGHQVTALDNLVTGNEKNIEDLKGDPNFKFENLEI
jgi:nucleoside-diphosphate-sugar epimerase